MKKVELMSPAGDLERLKIAFLYGADAVYIGGEYYSLRANASNFTIDEIKEACKFAHKLGKKVYVTINIIFHNEDITGVIKYIEDLVKVGVDALIVADIFLVDKIKEKFDIDIFVSTQASIMNIEAVKYLEKKGVKRVVLAREVSLKEINEICKNTTVDIEVFLHGAMCSFVSGRCVLSNYFTNRDSNRGGCAQVCRFCFDIGKKVPFSVAAKDLMMAEHIDKLIQTGISSLKIEGRMRSMYYLAVVVSSYRKLIDLYYENKLTKTLINKYNKILQRVANRESTSQFFMHKANYKDQYYNGRFELSNQDFLALVTGYDKRKKELILEVRNYFKKGDKVLLFGPGIEDIEFIIDDIKNEDNELIEVCNHPKEIVRIKFLKEVPINSMIRINNM